MTRQRNTHLFILALVPTVVFGAVRCADSTAGPPPATNAVQPDPAVAAKLAKLHQEHDWVGQFHNEALKYVLATIQRGTAKSRDRRALCEAARRAYGEFHKNRRGSTVPGSVDADFARFCKGGSLGANSLTVITGAPGGPRKSELSPNAQGFLDQIVAAIDASTSYGDLNDRVSSIEASAVASLGSEEAGAIVAVGSVTRSSASYWANNLPSWLPFTNTADYTVLLAPRALLSGSAPGTPAFNNDPIDWGTVANGIWNDAKRAAKRAAGGDARAAVKVIIAGGVAETPIIWEIIVASAAVGSIMSVLQL